METNYNSSSIDLPDDFSSLVDQLDSSQFHPVLLGTDSLIVSHTIKDDVASYKRTGYCTTSNFKYEYDYLRYEADKNIPVKHKKKPGKLLEDCCVTDLC